MAPVLAIASLVANAVDTTRLFDPVGEIFKPFVTGPNWIVVCPARRTAMAAEKKLWNRKERKELARQLQSANPGLEIVHPHAAGIDVGNQAHYVAVRPDRDPEPVRRFECFTADLHRLADWLQSCGVKTVALQSTGVYWIPLYDILEEQGFEVYLVNAQHTKNLPGRKSDVQESQWLLKLHTYGLLKSSKLGVRRYRTLALLRATRKSPTRQRGGIGDKGARNCPSVAQFGAIEETKNMSTHNILMSRFTRALVLCCESVCDVHSLGLPGTNFQSGLLERMIERESWTARLPNRLLSHPFPWPDRLSLHFQLLSGKTHERLEAETPTLDGCV